ncbi:hypothetical protein SPBRAN_576 [uncultured Candidatus Thioglobus sp.]|nr:hypothetical protein SPBRAN_576 [uncultured Candidatus Thioglobus sp.]
MGGCGLWCASTLKTPKKPWSIAEEVGHEFNSAQWNAIKNAFLTFDP